MLAELYVTKGRETGKALELSPGSSVSFGRALSNDVRIRDAQVSRCHCRFECTEQGLIFKDMSGNGTFVNADRIKGIQVPLKDGDTIRLGMTEIRVLIESEEEARERAESVAARPSEAPAESIVSESTVEDVVKQGNPQARTLGQPKITLAELNELKKTRARRADTPPPAPAPPAPSPVPAASVPPTTTESSIDDDDESEEQESTVGLLPASSEPEEPSSVGPESPPAAHEAGHLREVIPGYRIEAKLGGGGRRGTVVYRALQLALDRLVALKVLLPGAAASEKDLGRFLREAAAIARLPHPNVVTIHDAGRAGERRYIVMELLTGGSLSDLLEDQQSLPLDETLLLASDVARALAFAHARGIVHRSIRPVNVLRDAHGTWKLVDFGLARDVLRGGGGETNFIDAPLEAIAYLAPEQVTQGGTVDARSDIYSAGALLYHALTGKPPVWGDSVATIASQIGGELPLEPLLQKAPGALANVVKKCLARDPQARPEDGQTFLRELAAAQPSGIRTGPRPRGVRAT